MPESFQSALTYLQPFHWVLLVFFMLLYLLQAGYLFFFTRKVAFMEKISRGKPSPLTILLSLRNEEENLRKNLPQVLAAENGELEVVAIDDFSYDNSLTVLGVLKRQHRNLRVSSLNQEIRFSEKMGRNIALKAAQHDWVMVLSPCGSYIVPTWLAEISHRLDSRCEVVVNYSGVEPKDTLLNLLFRVEYFFQQLKSFGFILNGLPFIVSEDNVAFKKQKYFEAGGYREKVAEPYANLELVINSFMKKATTRLHLSGETVFQKGGNISKNRFFELLKKEVNLRKYLGGWKRFCLVMNDWTNLLFLPVTALVLVYLPWLWPLIGGLLLVFSWSYSFIIKRILNRLDERKLFLSSLLVALLLPYFKLFFRAGYYYHDRRKRWKRRK